MKAIITVLGTDKVGIIAKVCSFLADREINLIFPRQLYRDTLT